MRFLWALAMIPFTAIAGGAASPALTDPFLIVPGKQFGPLKLPATEADVVKAFGAQAVAAELDQSEGGLERGTVLFPCDAQRSAILTYDRRSRLVSDMDIRPGYYLPVVACVRLRAGVKDAMLKRQLPGDFLDIDKYNWQARGAWEDRVSEKASAANAKSGSQPASSAWHLSNGVRIGTTIRQLQKLNGRPFEIAGAEGDGFGGVKDWRHGKLSSCLWEASFEGPASAYGVGLVFHSDDPALGGEDSRVWSLYIYAAPRVPGLVGCSPEAPE